MAKKDILRPAFWVGLSAGSAAVLTKRMKEKGVCPFCELKRIAGKLKLHPEAQQTQTGVARTPPMGWSSWNLFERNISETLIKEIADNVGFFAGRRSEAELVRGVGRAAAATAGTAAAFLFSNSD